jgi:hypothetical protein
MTRGQGDQHGEAKPLLATAAGQWDVARPREFPGMRPNFIPMKGSALLLALALLPLAARSESVDVGLLGSASVTPPKDWTMTSQKEEDSGVAITLTAPAGTNANLIINLTGVPKEEPVTREMVRDAVLTISDKFVDESVEKRKDLRDLKIEGYGYYCVFTDASLVGKPSKKDEFKVVGVGAAHLTDGLMATIGISCDDEKGPEFAAMLEAVATVSFTPKK